MNPLAAAKALTQPTPDPDALRAVDLLLSGQAEQALETLGIPPESPIGMVLLEAGTHLSELQEALS